MPFGRAEGEVFNAFLPPQNFQGPPLLGGVLWLRLILFISSGLCDPADRVPGGFLTPDPLLCESMPGHIGVFFTLGAKMGLGSWRTFPVELILRFVDFGSSVVSCPKVSLCFFPMGTCHFRFPILMLAAFSFLVVISQDYGPRWGGSLGNFRRANMIRAMVLHKWMALAGGRKEESILITSFC